MKKKTKTFLVTGGTGFIGSNICKMLIKEGHKVLIYDNNSRGSLSKISIIKKKIVFIKGDIRDKKKVFQSIKKVNAVIHLAYINGTKYFYTKPDLILDIAVKGIVNILDGCKKYNVKELYLASSSEVYQTPIKVPTDENEMLKIPDIYNSRYSYGGGKIISELMSLHYGKKFFKNSSFLGLIMFTVLIWVMSMLYLNSLIDLELLKVKNLPYKALETKLEVLFI